MSRRVAKLSARERRLAVLTALVVIGAAAVFVGRLAAQHVTRLGTRIEQAELELENLTKQYMQRGAVDAAYRQVIAEHSSELTKQEIHDNLRREIYRLARVELPARGEKPARVVELVRIPALREGQLKESGKGYREYHIRFRIPTAHINLLVQFLERIETSEQLLRIDMLKIMRSPQSSQVEAVVGITRTVLDNPDQPRSAPSAADAAGDGEAA